jgi:imidazolonepropionase-like amidohydrolase
MACIIGRRPGQRPRGAVQAAVQADVREVTMPIALPTRLVFAVLLAALWGGGARSQAPQATVLEGARVIVGDGSAPIEDASVVLSNGRITQLGRRADVAAPASAIRVDLAGRTVMPALIDAHVHMGYRSNTSFTGDNYTHANLIDILDRFAYFGIAAILETGTARGELAYRVRDEAHDGARYLTSGRGFGMPNAGPGGPMRDSAYGVTSDAQARQYVRELAERKVDMIKIWVDDRNHTVEKLRPDLYRAIIDEAHQHRIRVMAHIVDLADAKDLLRAGIDGFAHMVRDREIDEELISLARQRPDVFFLETLWGERRALYDQAPAWLGEPLLRTAFSAESLRDLAASLAGEGDTAAVRLARERSAIGLRNTAKLYAAGIRLGLGTDLGGVTGGQYFGWGSHIELDLMVNKAGLTPLQAITIGTRNSARILGLDDLGTIAPGKSADLLVVDGDPSRNIAQTRAIDRVYLRGRELPRSSQAARWASEFATGPVPR